MARKRHSRRRQRAAFARKVHSVMNTYPYNTALGHDSGSFSAALNGQQIGVIGSVGCFNKPTGDAVIPLSQVYKQLMPGTNLIQPYNATYATRTMLTQQATQLKFYVKYQKLRIMMTNSSSAVMYCELYHLYQREAYDASNPNTMNTTITSAANFAYNDTLINQNTNVTITNQTPGVTLYDNPVLTRVCFIRRIGLKRLDPGANAVHVVRTPKGIIYEPIGNVSASIDSAYLPKYTIHVVARIWGEVVTGTTSPCMAPVKLVYANIYRTKFKMVSDPIYGAPMVGADSNTLSSGTAPVAVNEMNPAATTVTGYTPSVI